MPDKASRTNSVTPASDKDPHKREEDDVESVDMLEEELDEEGYDNESCDEAREMRVRFKVRGLLRVIKFLSF